MYSSEIVLVAIHRLKNIDHVFSRFTVTTVWCHIIIEIEDDFTVCNDLGHSTVCASDLQSCYSQSLRMRVFCQINLR